MANTCGNLHRRLAYVGLAGITLLIVFVAWRMFLGPKAPERDYRQELIDLSRSIVPETPEARRNTEIMVRVLRDLEQIADEERKKFPQDQRDLIAGLASDYGVLNIQNRPDAPRVYGLPEHYGPTLKHAQRVHTRYMTEIVPLLDTIDRTHGFSASWEVSPPGELLVGTQSGRFSESSALHQLEGYTLSRALEDGDKRLALDSLDRLAVISQWQVAEPTVSTRLLLLLVQSEIDRIVRESVTSGDITGDLAGEVFVRFTWILDHAPDGSDQIEMERLVSLSTIEGIHSNDPNMYIFPDFEKVTPWPIVNLVTSERASYKTVNDIYDRIRAIEEGGSEETYSDVIRATERQGSPLLVISQTVQALANMLGEYREQRWRSEVTLTMLALEVYFAEHGEYPRVLADLVPRYIERVPEDPLDPDGSQLRYRILPEDHSEPVNHSYLLWSVGPDGVDDAGDLNPKALRPHLPAWFKHSPMELFYLVKTRRLRWEGDIPLNMSEEWMKAMLSTNSAQTP